MSITLLGADDFAAPINFVGMYSDATTMIKPGTELWNDIVLHADTVELRPHSLTDLIAGLSVVDGINAYPKGSITKLILPYIPGARMDRVNPTGDVGYMLRTVARIINSYGFDSVLVADPHSFHAYEEINRMFEFPLPNIYAHLPKIYNGVIAPDKGAKSRAEIAGKFLRVPVTQATKERSVEDGSLLNFEVSVVKGAHYIVIDDICDGGGTFMGLGEKIKEQGATADLFVTHGIFAKNADKKLKSLYETVMTTNTRDTNANVTKFDIITEMRNYNV